MIKNLYSATLTALVVSGCVVHDLQDTCEFSTEPLLYDLDASELVLYVVSPKSSAGGTPIVNFYDADNEPVLEVGVVETQDRHGSGDTEAPFACDAGVSRAYTLAIDGDAWASYAAKGKNRTAIQHRCRNAGSEEAG